MGRLIYVAGGFWTVDRWTAVPGRGVPEWWVERRTITSMELHGWLRASGSHMYAPREVTEQARVWLAGTAAATGSPMTATTLPELILAHLRANPGTWQTALDVAAIVTPGERSRRATEALYALVGQGQVELRGGQFLGDVKAYRVAEATSPAR